MILILEITNRIIADRQYSAKPFAVRVAPSPVCIILHALQLHRSRRKKYSSELHTGKAHIHLLIIPDLLKIPRILITDDTDRLRSQVSDDLAQIVIVKERAAILIRKRKETDTDLFSVRIFFCFRFHGAPQTLPERPLDIPVVFLRFPVKIHFPACAAGIRALSCNAGKLQNRIRIFINHIFSSPYVNSQPPEILRPSELYSTKPFSRQRHLLFMIT